MCPNSRCTPSLFLVAVIWCLSSAFGEDRKAPLSLGEWPGWRGANRDGLCSETGLLDAWDQDGPPLLWRVRGLGQGYSTVAVKAGKIYTMGQRDEKEWLLALDEETGRELWAAPVGSGKPKSTPTVDGGRVFALGQGGELVCVDAVNGQEYWRINLVRDFGGKAASDLGYTESPLVDADRVVCTPGAKDAMMVALDRGTGDILWQVALPKNPQEIGPKGVDGTSYSSAVVSQACGERQYVQLVGRGVISVRSEDGKLLWIYNGVANEAANIATPIVRGDHVFCSTAYNTGSALLKVVSCGNEIEVEEVYFLEAKELQNHHGGLVLVGDHIYSGHGQNNGFPVCLEMKSGQVAWRPGRGPGTGSAAVLYADGNLYFRYENGVMALIGATPEKYLLKGVFKIASHQGKSWPHPVIAGGRLYLRDEDVLLCYNLRRSEEVEQSQLPVGEGGQR